jgi:hypothetical protein
VPWVGWTWWLLALVLVLPIVRASARGASELPRLDALGPVSAWLRDAASTIAVTLVVVWPFTLLQLVVLVAVVAPDELDSFQGATTAVPLIVFMLPLYPLCLATLARTGNPLFALLPGFVRRTAKAMEGRQAAPVIAAIVFVFPFFVGAAVATAWPLVGGLVFRVMMVAAVWILAHLVGRALRGVPLAGSTPEDTQPSAA